MSQFNPTLNRLEFDNGSTLDLTTRIQTFKDGSRTKPLDHVTVEAWRRQVMGLPQLTPTEQHELAMKDSWYQNATDYDRGLALTCIASPDKVNKLIAEGYDFAKVVTPSDVPYDGPGAFGPSGKVAVQVGKKSLAEYADRFNIPTEEEVKGFFAKIWAWLKSLFA